MGRNLRDKAMSICAEKIAFSYCENKELLLKDFNCRFDPTEIVAVTGPNGCGKTTLAKLLLGILKPKYGSVHIDGQNVGEMSLAEVGRKIGYVMQNPAQQLFCTSVEDEVLYGLKNLKLPPEEIKKRCDAYLKYFQMEQYSKTFPAFLSQGEKQRVVLAAILAMKPAYLLLDEPTASLDPCRRRILSEYLIRIRTELGCGIVVISHDREFIASCADRELQLVRRNR